MTRLGEPIGLRFRLLTAAAAVVSVAAAGPIASAGADVTGGENSAGINFGQALSAGEQENDQDIATDFFTYSNTFAPPDLVGPEGRSHVVVQQASSIVTPSASFPLAEIQGFGTSGRLLMRAQRTGGSAGYPAASGDGFIVVDFDVTEPTPIQFAGSMVTLNQDPNSCSYVEAEIGGPFSRSIEAESGGGCSSTSPATNGFAIERDLQPGSYQFEVDFGGTVGAGGPGSDRRGRALVDVTLAFLPPNTTLTGARINQGAGRARFTFGSTNPAPRARGGAKFQCALSKGKRKPRFRRCSSPKTYRDLRSGRYLFQARVVGPVAPDATPVKKRFRIP